MSEFGELLIAAYINLPPIFDSSIELHRLTVACAIVSYGYVTFYVVVYQPQSTSVYFPSQEATLIQTEIDWLTLRA